MYSLSNSLKKALSGLIVFSLLIASTNTFAQNTLKGNLGIRGTASISANRFGTLYCPSLFYKSERSLLSFGINFQERNSYATGLQLNYEYTLVDPSKDLDCNLEWLELYAFLNFNYHYNAFLGKSVCEEERYCNKELTVDPGKIKLKAIDNYIGFGIRIMLTQNIKWFNGVGIGAFNVFNSPDELFYNNKGLGLLMRTGISYQFGRKTQSKF
jgi:hypothetical protein